MADPLTPPHNPTACKTCISNNTTFRIILKMAIDVDALEYQREVGKAEAKRKFLRQIEDKHRLSVRKHLDELRERGE